jgi:molybdopterin-guanine dinucleotide biosynthesis protein A
MRSDITGLVLAGGQGSRMGGVDKGLQGFCGQPLALHALQRLAPQVAGAMISANRNLPQYAAFGAPVWPDAQAGPTSFRWPLAGMLAGLAHCRTPWLATVPCDCPAFPLDLVARLAAAAARDGADIAMACAPESLTLERGAPPSMLRPQPVFCLLRASLYDSLAHFIDGGGHRVRAWMEQHSTVRVPFDDAEAFANANTLEELRALEAARG